jgi:outer membrane biosynthesis protein TonB
MSINNERSEARIIIKKLVEFNVANNYYQQEEKNEIAREFKKLLFVDDPVVRKFLEKLLVSIKSVAQEFDLLGSEVEVDQAEEEKPKEEEVAEKEQTEEEQAKEKEEQPTEEAPTEEAPVEENPSEEKAPPLPESVSIRESYIKRASELVIDLL